MKIPSAKPYIPSEDIPSIFSAYKKIYESGHLTLGPYGKNFETSFSQYIGTDYAVSTNSGTSALTIALRCLLKKDDEVIVPTNTFIATPNSVLYARGKPVFVDVYRNTLCLNPNSILDKITSKTRGIIVVHIGGSVCPHIKEIRDVCKNENLFLLEDAAHAHGSTLDGKKAGSFGDVGCFSFYPTKVMTTGEGGMITTNNKDTYNKALILRDQGKSSFSSNDIVELGSNCRMSEFHAVLGVHQLQHLDQFISRRNHIARMYDDFFTQTTKITPMTIPCHILSNYYKYIAFLDSNINREKLKADLKLRDISLSGEVYDPPCHLQPIYKQPYNFKEGDFPNAEYVSKSHICLPLYTQMTDEEINYVLENLKEIPEVN